MELNRTAFLLIRPKIWKTSDLVWKQAAEPQNICSKKSINAGKVHRTGILKFMNTYIPVLCTSWRNCNLKTTNINGALHLKGLHCFIHTKRCRPFTNLLKSLPVSATVYPLLFLIVQKYLTTEKIIERGFIRV